MRSDLVSSTIHPSSGRSFLGATGAPLAAELLRGGLAPRFAFVTG